MKKILVTLMTAMLIMASFVPVFAEKYDDTNPIHDTSGSTANVKTTEFDKYLVMKKGAKVPYADFWYTLSADAITGSADPEQYPEVLIPATNNTPTDEKPVVWKGVKPEKVKITADGSDYYTKAEITFEPGDSTTDGQYRQNKGDIATTKEKYVKETMTFDFTNVTFAEPGVYRYYLEESNADTYSDLGIEMDVNVATANKNWRTLDVYILDDGNGNLYIADYVWYEGKLTTSNQPSHTANAGPWSTTWTDSGYTYTYAGNDTWNITGTGTLNGTTATEPPAGATGSVVIDGKTYTTFGAAKTAMKDKTTKTLTPNGAEASTPKSSEFVNKYGTQDLEFGKKVEGNQGSRDQWFEFKLELESADSTKPLPQNVEFPVNVGAYTSSNPANAQHFFAPSINSATSYNATAMKAANADVGAPKKAAFDWAKNLTDENIIITNASGKISWTIYLQHGQYIQVKGIPNGVKYTVTETDPATGYKKINGTDVEIGVIDGEQITNAHKDPLTGTIGSKATKTYVKDPEGTHRKDGNSYVPLIIAGGKAYVDAAAQTAGIEYTGDRYSVDENVYTGVTNKRSGVIPTGIIMSVAGGFAIVMIAIGFLLMINRRRKEYDYE